MKKKLLAFLLALSMAAPYAPAVTFAASAAESGETMENSESEAEVVDAETEDGEADIENGEEKAENGEADTENGEEKAENDEADVNDCQENAGISEENTEEDLENAGDGDENADESNVKYVTMNVPYDDFYAAYNLTDKAVWDVNGEGLDAVSTATASKFTSTDGLALGTYNDGTYILGVTLPVAVEAADYAKLDATITAGDYAFTDLTEVPTVYSELTIGENGSYSFSALQAYTGDTTGLSVIESANGFTTAGYGDYQIDLEGVLTAGTLANGESYKAIYGVVLHTDNGKALGMTALENMWFGTRVTNVEVAWSITEGQGLKRAHGSGDNFYQFSDLNGQKLTSVDVITAIGVITIPCDITMTQYYNGAEETTAAVKDSQTLTVSYPSALEDAQVSVTYKAGRATTTLADKVTPENGEVALDAALNVLETTYTVTAYSSNYAPISTTFTYGKKNQGTGKVQKFTYWVTVNAERNEAGDITSIAFSDDTVIGDQNAAYAETAMEGMQEQIAAKGSITSVNDLDVVSGATLTSNAIKAAVAEMNGEEFDLTAANGSLVMGKNGELGLADSIKKAENFLKISALEKDNEGNYITDGKSEAWMTLYDLYNQAVEMKAANDQKENYEEGLEEGLIEAKIDVAIAAVKAESGSGDRGGASQAGDTTNLQAVVDSAKALVEAKYTPASWKVLQDELSEAESLIATGKANQSALDAQQADLENAVNSLVKVENTFSAPVLKSVKNVAGGVTVTWAAVTGAENYRVYYKVSGGSWKSAGTTKGTSFTVKGLTFHTTYFFTVKCVSADGKTTMSSYNKTGKSITYTANIKPTAANASSGITVKWSKVTGAAGYYLYRKTGSGKWSRIKTLAASATSYTDTAVKSKNGTVYTYAVKAYKGSAAGSYTAVSLCRLTGISLTSAKNSSGKAMTVKWGKNAKATGYLIQYSTSKTFANGNKSVVVKKYSSVSRTISGLTKGKTYYVRIRDYKTVGTTNYYSAWSAVKTVKIAK